MNPIKIKVPKAKKKFKETEEERKERISHWQCTRTRVKESKKTYKREKFNSKDFI